MTIKLWQNQNVNDNIFNFESILAPNKQTSEITTLTFFNYIYLIVGLADSTIKYWNTLYLDQNPMTLSNGHTQAITYLYNFNNLYLLSGSLDRKIIVWNSFLINYNELTVHKGRINSIVYLTNQS